jgi:hypothetical protein
VLEISRRARTFTQAGQEQLKQSYKKLIELTQKVRAQAAAVLMALKDHQLVVRPEAFLKVMAALSCVRWFRLAVLTREVISPLGFLDGFVA